MSYVNGKTVKMDLRNFIGVSNGSSTVQNFTSLPNIFSGSCLWFTLVGGVKVPYGRKGC